MSACGASNLSGRQSRPNFRTNPCRVVQQAFPEPLSRSMGRGNVLVFAFPRTQLAVQGRAADGVCFDDDPTIESSWHVKSSQGRHERIGRSVRPKNE
jgi:hypothetical protein